MHNKNISSQFVILISFLTCILSVGCGVNKHLRNCLVADSKDEARIISQIDSVYLVNKAQECMKFKKIVSCERARDTIFAPKKTTLILKIENRCKTLEYFYFDNHLKLIEVSHELEAVN